MSQPLSRPFSWPIPVLEFKFVSRHSSATLYNSAINHGRRSEPRTPLAPPNKPENPDGMPWHRQGRSAPSCSLSMKRCTGRTLITPCRSSSAELCPMSVMTSSRPPRILYGMQEMGLQFNKKSTKASGRRPCIGRLPPPRRLRHLRHHGPARAAILHALYPR